MNDRELLELAAKAAGIQGEWVAPGVIIDMDNGIAWNPLTDDGDALRLAAGLRLDVLQDELSVSVKRWNSSKADADYLAAESIVDCRYAATRRAIVRAAAEIGKAEGSV